MARMNYRSNFGTDAFVFPADAEDFMLMRAPGRAHRPGWLLSGPNDTIAAPEFEALALPNVAPTVTIGGTILPVGPEARVNTTTAGFQGQPSIASLEDGGYVVTWSENGIYAQRYDASGTPVGAETLIAEPLPLRSLNNSSVVGLSNGGFVVTWTDTGSGEERVFHRLYDASGSPLGSAAQVNTYDTDRQFDAHAAGLTDGGYVIVWQSIGQDGSEAGIYAQRYDASGARLGGETRVNTFTAGTQYSPEVAVFEDGSYLIAWTSIGQNPASGYSIYAQRFDAAGIPVGGETLLGPGLSPSIAVQDDGTFVLAWQPSSTSSDSIYFRQFDATGVAIGPEVLVDQAFFGTDQLTHDVVALDGGGFAVAYTLNRTDGSGYGVFVRQYDATGTAIGGRTQVNSYTSLNQDHPAVAGLSGGGYAVAWDSNGQDGSSLGIYSQLFGATLATVEQSPVSIRNRFEIADADAGGGTLTLEVSVDYGLLTASAGGSGVSISGSGTGTVTVTGTLTQIQFFLGIDPFGVLDYTPNTDAPPESAVLTVSVNDNGNTGDGGPLTDVATITLEITPVNDAPSGEDIVITIAEDSVYVFDFTEFGFSDIDGNNLAAFQYDFSGPGTFEQDPNTFELRFTPAFGGSGDGYASISFQVIDDGGTANGGIDTDPTFNTITFDVTPVNDAPHVQPILFGLSLGAVEQQPTVITYSADFGIDLFTFSDPDAGDGLVTLTLSVDYGRIETSVVGLLVTGDGTDTVTITGTLAQLNDELFSPTATAGFIEYYPDTDAPPATANLTLTLSDNGNTGSGGALSDTVIIPINIIPVNDAPSGTDGTIIAFADAAHAFTLADFGFSDVDDNALLSVRITTLPGQGVIALNGAPVPAGVFVTASDIAAGLLTFAPATGETGAPYTSFTFQLRDDGGTASGGVDTDQTPNTLVIDVNAGGVVLYDASDALVGSFATIQAALDAAAADYRIEIGGGSYTESVTFGVDGLSLSFDPAASQAVTYTPAGGTFGIDVAAGDLSDTVTGGGGNDTIDGGGGDDSLVGRAGRDLLIGGAGNDTLNGGGGIDTASFENAAARVIVSLARLGPQDTQADGIDTLISIENLTGSGFDDRLFGDANANVLQGLLGNDFLNGREGADSLSGGDGDDRLLGGGGNDLLEGSAGADRLDGGLGVDEMAGGAGNDSYYLDTSADVVIEAADGGIDAVFAGLDYTLGANVENLKLLAGTWDGTGNALANTITGSAGANTLLGLGGDDRLFGEGGPDVLDGGAGNDRLFGGAGRDTMTGGVGADRFVFEGAEDLGQNFSAADVITDFNHGDGDRIQLTAVDAVEGGADNAFSFIGTAAFSGTAGELRYFSNGSTTFIEMDVDGDGLSDMAIRLTGDIDLVAADFFF